MNLSGPESIPPTVIPAAADPPAYATVEAGVAEGVAPPETESLRHLFWLSDSGWAPLPDWAQFVIEVAARIASFDSGEARLVVVLALPTRAFAAAFAAAGAVVASFQRVPPERNLTEHFEYLASLPGGTPVTLHERNSMVQGRLLGASEDSFDGRRRLKIQLPNEIRRLEARTCAKVQVIQDPGALSTRRRKLVHAPRFLSFAAHGVETTTFCTTTRLDCVIIGPKNTLKYELAGEKFAAGPPERPYGGTLQEIARTREFARQNDPYRSVVLSATPDSTQHDSSTAAPPLVIFDGAVAFNNWRSRWRASNWLIVLDRSSSSAGDEAASVNAAYATRIRDSSLLSSVPVPRAVESVCYLERR